MENTSPRLWTYTPANSPVALPKQSLLFHPSELTYLDFPVNQPDSVLSDAHLQEYCGTFRSAEQTVDEMLQSFDEAPMAERRPFLLLGELATPTDCKTSELVPCRFLHHGFLNFAGHMQTVSTTVRSIRESIMSRLLVPKGGGKKHILEWPLLLK